MKREPQGGSLGGLGMLLDGVLEGLMAIGCGEWVGWKGLMSNGGIYNVYIGG